MMHDDSDDPFDRALGLPAKTMAPQVYETLPDIIPEQNVEIRTFVQNDYEFARKTMRDLIAAGSQVFMDCADVAKQSQSPDAYVSAASIMKNIIDANEKLVKLSESHAKVTDNKKREIQREKDSAKDSPVENVTNNNLIITTTELQDLVDSIRNGKTNKPNTD